MGSEQSAEAAPKEKSAGDKAPPLKQKSADPVDSPVQNEVSPVQEDKDDPPERCMTKEVSLDEGEERKKAFEEYVRELDPQSHHNEPPRLDLKRDACGLGCGAGGKEPSTARQFAAVIQDMIRKILVEPTTVRMRVFDNHTITFDVEGGLMATFEECRSTQFRRLRAAAGITEEDYLSSMCSRPFSGGEKEASGKSGSLFLRTHDNRLVLKTIEQHEFEALYEILPNYVLYLEENVDSLLCRFVGAYSLTVQNITLRLAVMANVLPDKADQVYDLKGTTEDRWVDPMIKGAVLKDNNFAMNTVLLEAGERKRLIETIRDDAEFLESLGLMDYSLLLGMTEPQEEEQTLTSWLGGGRAAEHFQHTRKVAQGFLQCAGHAPEKRVFQLGIIDYLQRWTPKKVAAHWLKKPTLGVCFEIDTEPPGIYSKRFYKYFHAKIAATGTGAAVCNGY